MTIPPLSSSRIMFSNLEWVALLKFRAGVTVMSNSLCNACGQPASKSGDHSLACASCGLWRRHNLVRDQIAALCRDAGWHSQLEVALPAEAGPHLRPADVFLSNMGARPVALDIGVSHPLRPSAPGVVRETIGESAERHEALKLNQMSQVCSSFGWRYYPICFEATGAWGPGAAAFMRKLARNIAGRGILTPADAWSHVLNSVHLALAKGCAEMLVKGAKPPVLDPIR